VSGLFADKAGKASQSPFIIIAKKIAGGIEMAKLTFFFVEIGRKTPCKTSCR